MAQPTDLQNAVNTVQWTNGRQQITGSFVMGLFALILSIFSGMGTWTNGTFSVNSAAILAGLGYIPAPRVSSNTDLGTIGTGLFPGTVMRDGFAAAGDGGRAVYVHSTSACSISGGDGFTQVPASDGNCWLIDPSQGQPSLFAAGAKGDGVTDDGPAFATYQHLFGSANGYGAGGTIHLPPGRVFRIGTSFSLYQHVAIEGDAALPDVEVAPDWAKTGGLSIDSTATINMSENAQLRNLFIKQTGLTFPVASAASYAGQPITFGDAIGEEVQNVTVIGFNKCIGESASVGSIARFVIRGFYGDCNNGIYLSQPSADSSIIRDVHLYPFAQPYPSTQASLLRSGYGLYIGGQNDDLHIDNFFELGYAQGATFNNTSAVNVGKMWLDYPVQYAANSGSIGLNVSGNTAFLKIDQLWVYSYGTGVIEEGVAATRLRITQGLFSAQAGDAIQVQGGDLSIERGDWINNGGASINVQNTISQVYARGTTSGDEGGNTSAAEVGLPSSGTADSNLIDIKLKTDKVPGTPLFSAAMSSTTLASAATVGLPNLGDAFTISGTTPIATLNGGWQQREVTLQFTSAISFTSGLQAGGNIVLLSPYTSNNGSFLKLRYTAGTVNQWREVGRSP